MGERNYLVVSIYPKGGYSVLAQFANLHDAMLFLEKIMEETDNDFEIYGIKQVNVNATTTVHRYESSCNFEDEDE